MSVMCAFTRELFSDLAQSVLFVQRTGGVHFTLHGLIKIQLLLKTTVDPEIHQQLSMSPSASHNNDILSMQLSSPKLFDHLKAESEKTNNRQQKHFQATSTPLRSNTISVKTRVLATGDRKKQLQNTKYLKIKNPNG